MAASAKRSRPLAPMGLEESTPPLMLTGRSPSSWVTPSSTYFQPSPLGANRRFSSHIGSNHENGTYISTQSTWRRGSVMPAWRYTSLAPSAPPAGSPAARVGDAGLAVHVLGALGAADGQHGVAVGRHRGLAAHRRAVHPGHGPAG